MLLLLGAIEMLHHLLGIVEARVDDGPVQPGEEPNAISTQIRANHNRGLHVLCHIGGFGHGMDNAPIRRARAQRLKDPAFLIAGGEVEDFFTGSEFDVTEFQRPTRDSRL
jgi:hypothetical protein